ncbi:MAG: MFS transporter, partial [Gordonia sp. (in: high G+C Gram-positive bacteria)]
GCSQLALAFAPTVWIAIAARILLGTGDATVFPSVLRIIGITFPRRTAPVVVQVTGLLGQCGQIISIVPFAHLVRSAGWSNGFVALAATTVLLAVLAGVAVNDGSRLARDPGVPVRRLVSQSWAQRGTRMAFWTHFVAPFAANSFSILWGYPFLVRAEHLTPATAQNVLMVYVVAGVLTAPLIGAASARFAARRVYLVVGLVAIQAAAWLAVLFLAGPAPLWMLVVLGAVLCVGGPASMIAFDFAREHNPPHRLSSATGIVNGAGFGASVLVILMIGVILDVASPGDSDYGLAAFRPALLCQVPVWILGVGMLLWESRRCHAVVGNSSGDEVIEGSPRSDIAG